MKSKFASYKVKILSF